MTKDQAVELFGGSVSELAEALGITRQAIYQWPEELPQEQADRVVGAAIRLGRINGKAAAAASGVRPN